VTVNLPRLYPRTTAVTVVIGLGLLFAVGSARLATWSTLLPVFEWLETTPFGVIGKTWGAAFATVQALHLLAMAVLGGAVLVSDGRLLNVLLIDVPARRVLDGCHRIFIWSLLLSVLTGVFMACGVAIKIYYLSVFWYKMLALGVGVMFVFLVRRPLLQQDIDRISPRLRQLVAIASLMVWFSVAATGRWIGFSG
jgi:Family of unknown function (DUF6644)